MSLVGFKAQNHGQQVRRRGANPEVDDRATPPEVFGPLDAIHHFTLDVAASSGNAKCSRFYTAADDGLAQPWAGERVWCNPPYSDIRPWLEKAWGSGAEVVVMLLPANRTEQGWWQDCVEPFRDNGGRLRVDFLRGRTRFIRRGQSEVGANERPPFGCCLLTLRPAPLQRHTHTPPAGIPSMLEVGQPGAEGAERASDLLV